MTIAPLTNLLGADTAAYGGAYQNAQGQWVQDITDNEGTTHQQSLQDQLTPQQWQNFLQQQQYLTPSTAPGGQTVMNVNTAALPKVLGQIPISPIAQNMGTGIASLGNDQQAGPQLSRGVLNQGAVKWDPNYGWVTPMINLKSDDDLLNKIGGVVGDIAPYAIMAGITGAIGGLGGSQLLASLPSAAQGASQGDYSQILGSILQGLGLPNWATTLGQMGMNAARGGQVNPLQAGLTLGKIAGGIGG